MLCLGSLTVSLSKSPLAFFFSNGAICTGFAKNSFWREIIFPKGTNISLEELNSFWNILLVGFVFWKPEAFFNSQNRIFPTFHPKIPFSQELLSYYYNILSSSSVRHQWRSVLPSYIKTSIYISPLEVHGIFASPTAHPPAAIPAHSHSRWHWQDANSVTKVFVPREGLFKASVMALSSTD